MRPLSKPQRALSTFVLPTNILLFYERPLEKEHCINMFLSVHYFSPFFERLTDSNSPIKTRNEQQYNSCTHYYHAKKFEILGAEDECKEILSISSPDEAYDRAKVLEKKFLTSPRWHEWEESKVDVMRTAIRLKFDQNPTLMQKLLMTGDKTLIEDHPTDAFW